MPDQIEDRRPVQSADAKPRLKWTRQLHECFVDAVSQLGGADKATPKSVMQVMGIPGITLYHLKSHLQKYRLAKNREHKPNHKGEDAVAADCRSRENIIPHHEDDKTQVQFHDSRSTLKVQMEVQIRLQEQIEVQKHLQLRIEAQGKYLQSVLRKAQETLVGYNLNHLEAEAAKAELSELDSAANMECLSSTFSQATSDRKCIQYADCSTDSCLTSERAPVKSINGCLNDSSAESDESNPCRSREAEMEDSVVTREEIDLNR